LEEFYTDEEKVDLSQFESLGVLRYHENPKKEFIVSFLKGLSEELEKSALSKADIVIRLQQMMPEFIHQETGRNLDQSM
jgi:hypothetical protein